MSDELNIRSLIKKMTIKFQLDSSNKQKILINRKDASEDIRSEECGTNASIIARYERIRNDMISFQRSFLKKPGLIADGRDMGTVVFSDSKIKIFLTADVDVRAKRRYKELKDKGIDVSLPDLFLSIQKRDLSDTEREFAPLEPARDAVIIDSTAMTIDDVFYHVLSVVEEKLG